MAISTRDITNSINFKQKWKLVDVDGVGRITTEPVDSDDAFPPAVESYEVSGGWLVYHGHDGSIGAMIGSKASLTKWMANVDKENNDHPVVTELWDESKHGGGQLVRDTLAMANKTLKKFGIPPIQMEVWVSTRAMAATTANRNKITFVNIHNGHNEKILGVPLPWSKKVGAHEASHIGFMHHRDRGQYVMDVLKWRNLHNKPAISLYHALSGDFEGTAEAGAAYMLIPKVMESDEPELHAACAYWFGDGPKPNDGANAKLASNRMVLTDPMFNLREIVKQLTLLEDHLSHPYKMCMDCVRKHLITVEAMAEEASSMDVPDGETVAFDEDMAEIARVWMENVTDGVDPKKISSEIRALRKKLMPLVCDPRVDVTRVASIYNERGACPHRK